MRKLKTNALTWLILAAASLTVACGGMEQAPDEADLSNPLTAAPMAVLELDLPGCGCQADLAAGAVGLQADDTILRHPTDGNLRVAVRDGDFICVGHKMDMLMGIDTTQQSGGQGNGGGGSNVQAGGGNNGGGGGLFSDDPIPIINEFQGKVEENPTPTDS